ncbi:PTS sugar transporter subunit IIC [Eubacteriales bacterium OttesenSCG-928-M02]|nr:PTS sugar transporter subunit IIC [Eubacteriales bacterium OttesenSCG-928-M02]
MAKEKSTGSNPVKTLLHRWFIDGLGYMAQGLFASLIIGLIISQLSKIPGLGFMEPFTTVLAATSPVVGAAIGVAIAYGLKASPLCVFSNAAVGATAYAAGGPVGAYVASIVATEIGTLVSGKTKVDIVVVPFVTIVAGGLVGTLLGPPIAAMMTGLGAFINNATQLAPIPMGIIVSVSMGMILTAPISSAAIAISMGLEGIAAGAATIGCCANMIGFAVISFRENGVAGLISQGLGTSMLQVPNIVRKPIIWVPVIVASAILGPISTAVLHMTNNPVGAGMGTSGLVGQVGTFTAMAGTTHSMVILLEVILMHFVLPAVISLGVCWFMRRHGWIKDGDMKLPL